MKAPFTSWLVILYACTFTDSKMYLELWCYIGDVNKSKPVYEKKNYRVQKGQILYTLVVNISLVRASSVQSYAN